MTDPLTDLVATVRARLQDEIETQLQSVKESHVEAVARARREAELEADQRWSALLQEARNETQQQVEAAVEGVRREAVAAAQAQLPVAAAADGLVKTLADGFTRVGSTTTLMATLTAVADAAGAFGESTLFIVAGADLQPWSHSGARHAADELTRDAFARKSAVRSDAATAVPLVLDDTVVAVLYGRRRDDAGPAVFEAFDALAQFAAAHLATVTLARTGQAQQWLRDTSRLYGSAPTADTTGDASEDETAAARRFARLLVSEIKLYNEGAVRVGRERRDLLQRLGEEIGRARRLYEERVPATVPGRADHFHNELVQTLAGGDPALLG